MRPVSIDNLKKQFKGNKFNVLIEHHLRSQSPKQRQQGLMGTIGLLPEGVQDVVEYWIDYGNIPTWVKDRNFWSQDCSEALSVIVEGAKEFLLYHNLNEYINDEETLFNMFQVLVLNYAYSASSEPRLRAFMGIKGTVKQSSGCLGLIAGIIMVIMLVIVL